MVDGDVRDAIDRAVEHLKSYSALAVEYSGGVDSTLLAKLAHMALGDRAVAIIAVSPTLPSDELNFARELADIIGIRLEEVESEEFSNEDFLRNDIMRCSYCRRMRGNAVIARAEELGISTVADGVNADDLGDFRPGIKAADGIGIIHPFVDLELGKEDIRAMSKELGLPTWDMPASACLSSRIEHGIRITPEIIGMVERAESLLASWGFPEARARYHRASMGHLLRIEVPAERIGELLAIGPGRIAGEMEALGFKYVTLDLRGYRPAGSNVDEKVPME